MHTPDWRQSLRELCRVSRDRVVFDYPALSSAAALQAAARHARTRPRPARRGLPRLRRPRRPLASSRPTAFASPPAPPVRAADRVPQAAESAAATGRIEGALARAGLTRLLGSPVTVVASVALRRDVRGGAVRVLSPARPASPAGTSRARSRPAATTSARSSGAPRTIPVSDGPYATNLEPARLEPVRGDLRDPASIARAAEGVDVVYNIAALYRQAGLPRRGLPRGQRRRPCGR